MIKSTVMDIIIGLMEGDMKAGGMKENNLV